MIVVVGGLEDERGRAEDGAQFASRAHEALAVVSGECVGRRWASVHIDSAGSMGLCEGKGEETGQLSLYNVRSEGRPHGNNVIFLFSSWFMPQRNGSRQCCC